jgi:DDE superfamily endonuclease/Homeodomain-like domain
MARPYSIDLRERVVLAVERDGLSRNAAARRFGVAISTAVNWLRRHQDTGSVAPGKMGGHKPRKLIGARLLFLPPYSPDLNPIEQVFAKLKHLMRKAAERTAEATWKRSGTLLDLFKPDECAAYLANSGYAQT